MILHPSYFIDVVSLIHVFHCEELTFEKQDSYVKQTYRNRCYIDFTTAYIDDPLAKTLITAKSNPVFQPDQYMQVFQEKHGFISNLSALDLIFNLGPSSRVYLKSQEYHLERPF